MRPGPPLAASLCLFWPAVREGEARQTVDEVLHLKVRVAVRSNHVRAWRQSRSPSAGSPQLYVTRPSQDVASASHAVTAELGGELEATAELGLRAGEVAAVDQHAASRR